MPPRNRRDECAGNANEEHKRNGWMIADATNDESSEKCLRQNDDKQGHQREHTCKERQKDD